jgi:hypothetical protein
LFLVGVTWIVCGVVAFLALTASWKIVVSIVFIGIGLFWLRGAVTAVARREAHGPS